MNNMQTLQIQTATSLPKGTITDSDDKYCHFWCRMMKLSIQSGRGVVTEDPISQVWTFVFYNTQCQNTSLGLSVSWMMHFVWSQPGELRWHSRVVLKITSNPSVLQVQVKMFGKHGWLFALWTHFGELKTAPRPTLHMSDHWQLLHIDWHKDDDLKSLSALILWVRFTCPHPRGDTEVQGIQLTYWITRFDGAEGRRVWKKSRGETPTGEDSGEQGWHRKWKRGVTRNKVETKSVVVTWDFNLVWSQCGSALTGSVLCSVVAVIVACALNPNIVEI